MTLKEVASGNQYLRALLAGKSDGYCGELNGEDSRCRQKSPVSGGWRGCPAPGLAAEGQPWLGGWQCRPPTAAQLGSTCQQKAYAGVHRAAKQDNGLAPHHSCFLHSRKRRGCPLSMMGATSTFRQWVVLRLPLPGLAHDTVSQRDLSPAMRPWDWGQLEETGGRWGSREGSRHPSGVRVVWRTGKGQIGQARWQMTREALGQGTPGNHGEPKSWISWAKWGKMPVIEALCLVFLFSL